MVAANKEKLSRVPGIRSIAQHLRVSVSTVSSVINARGYVSPEMRERVSRYLREVNYEPNLVARSLRRQETKIIGLIVPDASNSFYSKISRGAEDFLMDQEYQLIVADSREDWSRQENYLKSFSRMRVDGILVVPAAASDEQISRLPSLARGRPLVYVDRSPMDSSVDAVLIDNAEASFGATQHLIELGHRRIAIITEPLTLLCAVDRLEGYRKALKQHGLSIKEEMIQAGNNTKDSGYEIGLRVLSGRTRPTAAVICNNLMTLGFLRALKECSIACPAAFSLIGFDECDWSEHMHPPLTTVQQPASEMGASAARLLLERIGGQHPGLPTIRLLGFELIKRGSTGPILRVKTASSIRRLANRGTTVSLP